VKGSSSDKVVLDSTYEDDEFNAESPIIPLKAKGKEKNKKVLEDEDEDSYGDDEDDYGDDGSFDEDPSPVASKTKQRTRTAQNESPQTRKKSKSAATKVNTLHKKIFVKQILKHKDFFM
jgi:hypothetical protein